VTPALNHRILTWVFYALVIIVVVGVGLGVAVSQLSGKIDKIIDTQIVNRGVGTTNTKIGCLLIQADGRIGIPPDCEAYLR
jgi:hypothetical protein